MSQKTDQESQQEPQQNNGAAILAEVAESVALRLRAATAEIAAAKEELNKAHRRLDAAIKHYEETRKAARE